MGVCTSLSSYPQLLELLLYWGDRNNLISSDYQKYKCLICACIELKQSHFFACLLLCFCFGLNSMS